MFTELFILFIKATTTTSPLVTPSPLLPALPSTTGSTPVIARNFTHRFTNAKPYYFTARYFTHDQCGE